MERSLTYAEAIREATDQEMLDAKARVGATGFGFMTKLFQQNLLVPIFLKVF